LDTGQAIYSRQKKLDIVLLVVSSNLAPIFAPYQRYGGLNVENPQFSLPHSYPDKIWGVSFGVDPSCWGLLSDLTAILDIQQESPANARVTRDSAVIPSSSSSIYITVKLQLR